MGKKVKANLTIDEIVVKRAKALGLNLSKVSENALIRAIKALETAYGENKSNIWSNNDQGLLGAGSGTRTHEGLRHRSLSPAP